MRLTECEQTIDEAPLKELPALIGIKGKAFARTQARRRQA